MSGFLNAFVTNSLGVLGNEKENGNGNFTTIKNL